MRKDGTPFPGSRILAPIVALGMGLVFLVFELVAHTPRARMNTMQCAATLLFLTVLVRWKDIHMEPRAPETTKASGLPYGLAFAWIAGACTWIPMLPFYFVSEDFEHLWAARRPMLSSLAQLSLHGQLGTFLRPVGFASIFLEYRLWGGWPAGYHITNLAVFLATAAGVYYLCVYLGWGAEIASIAALVYAVLPIHAEAVAWMGARFDLLSACFSVWSAAFYIRFRMRGDMGIYVASLACFVLAALLKENAYVLPLLLILAELWLMPNRRLSPALATAAAGACLFTYRWLALGGIGGYSDPSSRPILFHFSPKVFEGLLIRGPAQTLLGYNWMQPSIAGFTAIVSLTAALLFAGGLVSRTDAEGRKRRLFSFAWIVLAMLPAHPLLLINASLMNSRILHFGSIGLALLIAQVLGGIGSKPFRWVIAGLLACLLGLGALHNLGAWRWTSQLSKELLSELREANPSPETGTRYVFHDLPEVIRGVYFPRSGLADSVRFIYGRNDLSAERAPKAVLGHGSGSLQGPAIHMQWVGETAPLINCINSN
jgi:hypothetical protein